MTLPIYLAMTDEEIHSSASLPAQVAYMACHFSPYGTGLCNLPAVLPAGSILIINDRIPICNHDPEEILTQLTRLLNEITVSAILLDLQRNNHPQAATIARALIQAFPVPVGVSAQYARDLDCPVFVEPPALHVPLSEHLKSWHGRQIWLDTPFTAGHYHIDKSGCTQSPCHLLNECLPHQDTRLHCHYRIKQNPDHIQFTLQRTKEDMLALLAEGQTLGITTAIGLHQEWGNFP